MAECEVMNECTFYNGKMKLYSGIGKLYKTRYCLENNSSCAVYRIYKKLGKQSIPSDLYPNMTDKADAILAGENKTQPMLRVLSKE